MINERGCKDGRVASTAIGRRLSRYTTKLDDTANLLNLIIPPF